MQCKTTLKLYLHLDKERISVVARQTGFMIPWVRKRKMNPNMDSQDMACMERRLKKLRQESKNRMKKVRGSAKPRMEQKKKRKKE